MPPIDDKGGLSLDPGDWGIIVRYSPSLLAWSRLVAATSTERCVSGEGGTLHPVFSVVPEIRSSAPDIGYVRSLGPLFVPPSGHKFVVVKLKNLELRCFAFNCELRYHGSDVRLAWMFRYGDDPIEETAERLYTLAAEEAGKPAEWFQELKSSRPQEHDRWIRIARLLLFAVPRGVPASQLRELLRQEVDEDLGESTARRFQDWLIYKVHQELKGFLEDITTETLARRLGITEMDLYRGLHRPDLAETLGAALRNLLDGKIENQEVRVSLASLAQNDLAGRLLMSEDGPTRYFILFRPPTTPLGGVGRSTFCTHTRCAEHVQFADEMMKMVAYGLVGAGTVWWQWQRTNCWLKSPSRKTRI